MTASLDPAEIERFNGLATTWWDPDGPMWPLHKLNAARVPYILDTLGTYLGVSPGAARPLEGVDLLDIGCGAGLLSESLARLGANVTAVDPAERNIRIAVEHARRGGLDIDYRVGSVEAVAGMQFDVVTNMEVVEHVEQLPRFLSQCCALTAPGGMQFVATINRNVLSWLVAIIGAEHVLRWLPRGTHQWRKFVTPEELQAMLADGGLSVVDMRGVTVNPLARAIKVSAFKGVNYMLAAARHAQAPGVPAALASGL